MNMGRNYPKTRKDGEALPIDVPLAKKSSTGTAQKRFLVLKVVFGLPIMRTLMSL